MREEKGLRNIFLTEEEWQQRMDEARREIEAAQARLEDSKHKLVEAIAEREKDKRGKA